MIKHFFKYLANLKLAILILLVISVVIGIGTIIEQNKELLFYQKNYSILIFSIPLWKIILFLGFDNIYSTWWFLLLLSILGLSLACCTIIQQLPTLKFSRRYYFYKQINQYNKLQVKINAIKVFPSHLSHTLLNKQYSLFQQFNSFYAYKGLISRVGPIVVHISIICVLLGSTVGALTGFNSQELIPKTEVFHIQNVIKNGFFSSIPQKTFRINDFWSIYTTNGLIKQFYSDISILNGGGKELQRKTISVNNPLLLKELIVYQTDWGILGLRLKYIKKDTSKINLQLPISKINTSNQKLWISSIPSVQKNNKSFIVLIKDNRGQINLYNNEGKFIKSSNIGDIIYSTDVIGLTLMDIISSTGIQIKSDPGIQLIYFGFFFLMLSSLISYISFSEFWLLYFPLKVISGGKTNRAKVKYNLEFLQFKQSFFN
uniref:Cytochrome c biogenesis protein Ccs1 n=1 Tax=Pleurocladia lacustris TaxID=246121 RepID=A0A1I9LVB8_9PHAE|nr:cytochrome c biogenesis protein [Pleurocladia lacustris]ANS57538.1 cytochrome c biogenesis protein [Pleurocladia lacustris]ANS57682.1 cytochrome c biogenesis protein [Pleurocladia lacustris]